MYQCIPTYPPTYLMGLISLRQIITFWYLLSGVAQTFAPVTLWFQQEADTHHTIHFARPTPVRVTPVFFLDTDYTCMHEDTFMKVLSARF